MAQARTTAFCSTESSGPTPPTLTTEPVTVTPWTPSPPCHKFSKVGALVLLLYKVTYRGRLRICCRFHQVPPPGLPRGFPGLSLDFSKG